MRHGGIAGPQFPQHRHAHGDRVTQRIDRTDDRAPTCEGAHGERPAGHAPRQTVPLPLVVGLLAAIVGLFLCLR